MRYLAFLRMMGGTALLGACLTANATLAFCPNRTGQNVLKFDAETGQYLGAIASGFVGTAVTGCAQSPYDGILYVTTSVSGVSQVQKFDPYTGQYLGAIGSGFLAFGDGLAWLDANTLCVGDIRGGSNNAVLKFNPTTGQYLGMVGLGFIGGSGNGVSVCTDSTGILYAVGAGGSAIQKFNGATGQYLGAIGSGFFGAGRSLTMSATGKLLVSSLSSGSVMRFDPATGQYLGIFATGFCPAGRGIDNLPNGWVIVRTKNSQNIEYVCRFVPETGEYKGLFASAFNMDGFDIAAEKPAQICGTVTLQDWTLTPDRPIVVDIINTSTGITLESHNTTPDASGNFCVTTYERSANRAVAVKASHWLRQSTAPLTIPRGGLTGLSFSLINGDIDGDNEVGPGDFGILSSSFGSVDGDPNWDPEADLDGDGEVGPSDFGILSANFGSSGD